ncbi:magnesium transporter [Marinagarivorans cellulosilyticus]|uniref:Magnesium transporter n=1 Tax=Marinagarivorans cellulosilyticus TaxID=2721545 RepID=A0AAN1WL27_9GAMM|nr:magnesium transporter [Marinagarivorans cellulosilyticus]BCD99583.1 magnesium transporter [Marinagarivorans cellulosilyticus]
MTDNLTTLIEEVADATKYSTPDSKDTLIRILNSQEANEIALALESLPIEQRTEAWKNVAQDQRLDILVEMRSDPRESLLDTMPIAELDSLFNNIAASDLIELADTLPARLLDRAVRAMDTLQRSYFEDAQQYSEDVAGRWIDHDVLVLPNNAKVRDALRLLRRQLPDYVDCIFITNRAGHFSEAIRISRVFGSPDHVPLVDLAEEDFSVINAQEDAVAAATKVQRSGFSALPVVGENGKLLGRLDIGNACELTQEYYENQLMASAGMNEDEDLFSPIVKSTKNRAIWLGINLLTAFLASWFIGLFEATLQQVVALAVLMPVVASMGGIAGSQTLTLIIRGLALNQINAANRNALLKKELSVGALNGIVWAFVIAIVASIWFDSAMIGVVIALAILANILAAAAAGVCIPVILDKLKLDPALSGAVVLTTVTDIVGFVAFLGLGTLLLL